MADYSFIFIFLLLATGLVAGVINTLAGGGSNLTLPALMLMGLLADVANATNRVGVLCQCLVGARLGVGLALQRSQRTLKWFLFVMTLCASGAALWF